MTKKTLFLLSKDHATIKRTKINFKNWKKKFFREKEKAALNQKWVSKKPNNLLDIKVPQITINIEWNPKPTENKDMKIFLIFYWHKL